MTLYHGSIVKVETPSIMTKASYRPLDFGTGFYTTTSYDQATRWVRNRLEMNPDLPCGYVTAYDFDEKGFAGAGLRRLDFPNNPISPDWFRFIMRNRRERNPEHGYDLVTGPVANDRVYTVITAYEAGFATETEAIERLKPYRLADQYLFHTPAALTFLKAVTTVEVSQ